MSISDKDSKFWILPDGRRHYATITVSDGRTEYHVTADETFGRAAFTFDADEPDAEVEAAWRRLRETLDTNSRAAATALESAARVITDLPGLPGGFVKQAYETLLDLAKQLGGGR